MLISDIVYIISPPPALRFHSPSSRTGFSIMSRSRGGEVEKGRGVRKIKKRGWKYGAGTGLKRRG